MITFFTHVRPSARPHFSKSHKTKQFQGLVLWIIDDYTIYSIVEGSISSIENCSDEVWNMTTIVANFNLSQILMDFYLNKSVS